MFRRQGGWIAYLARPLFGLAGRVKSRAVKVGDGIEARPGSVPVRFIRVQLFTASFLSLSQISPVANPVYISW
jgi:hypothetical protein